MPDLGGARAGGFWHQPSLPGPDKAEMFVPRTGHEGAGDPESPAVVRENLAAGTSISRRA